MKFRPLHDRVVVRRIEEDDRTKGGIIIPDTAKEKPQQGEIVAVGPGAPDEKGKVQPLDVKPGDRVLFGKWSGTEVKLDGEELLIMKESDISACSKAPSPRRRPLRQTILILRSAPKGASRRMRPREFEPHPSRRAASPAPQGEAERRRIHVS